MAHAEHVTFLSTVLHTPVTVIPKPSQLLTSVKPCGKSGFWGCALAAVGLFGLVGEERCPPPLAKNKELSRHLICQQQQQQQQQQHHHSR